MTAYKKPVFFDRDIKAFSELSDDAGLDLGLVARSILADAYLQVGTTGTDGTVSVKNASDVETIKLAGADAQILIGGSGYDGYFNVRTANDANVLFCSAYDGLVAVGSFGKQGTIQVNTDSGVSGIVLEGQSGLATIGGPVAGAVSVKDANFAQTIQLDGSSARAALGGGDSAGQLVMESPGFGETIALSGATATATFGGPVAGTVSVKNASDAQTINLSGEYATATIGAAAAEGTLEMVNGDGVTTVLVAGGAGSVQTRDPSGNTVWFADAYTREFALYNTGTKRAKLVDDGLTLFTAAGESSPSVSLNSATATATIGGPAAGTVSVKDGSNLEVISLQAAGAFGATATIGAADSSGLVLVKDGSGTDRVALDGGLGVVSVKNSSGNAALQFESKDALAKIGTNGTAGALWMYDSSAAKAIELQASTASITLSGAASKITGLQTAEITQPLDAVNKAYVDSVVEGLDVKASCVAATTANITLSGEQTVGGVAVTAGQRVLVKNQTDATENGIYLCSADAWTRSLDMNADAEFPGAFTFIEGGDLQGTGWVCTNPSVTLGTTAITFSQFSGAGTYIAGPGIDISGTTISAVVDGVHAIINGSNQIDVAGLPLSFTIDAVATSANVTSANLGTLVDGPAQDAVALHSHSADAEYLAAATGLAAGQACVINASSEAATAGITASGAWMVGVVESIASGQARVIRGGLAVGVLSGATAGDVYYVQADGTLATDIPASGGRLVMAGIAKSATDLHVQVRDFGTVLAA